MMRDLIFTAIICWIAGCVMIVGNFDKLWRFSTDSPYLAAFTAWGMGVGLILSMVIILVKNYENKVMEGKKLIVIQDGKFHAE